MSHYWVYHLEYAGYRCANCMYTITSYELLTQFSGVVHPDELQDDLPRCSLDVVNDAELAVRLAKEHPNPKHLGTEKDMRAYGTLS